MLNRRYGAFGMLIMPVHFCLLTILPLMFLVAVSGMFALALGGSRFALALVGLGLLGTIVSHRMQALVRVQLVLAAAIVGLLTGIETQKLERLLSTRP